MARKLPLPGELAHQGVVVFLTLYGDRRHPPKARQGFWRMLAWLVTLSTVAARSLPLPFSLKKDRKYIEKCRKL